MKRQIKLLLISTAILLTSCGSGNSDIIVSYIDPSSNESSEVSNASSQSSSSIVSSSSESSISSSTQSSSSTSSSSSKSSSSIKLLDFEGITMNDYTVKYNGNRFTISPQGVPSGASVRYIGERYFSDAGSYTIKCEISKSGYNTLSLSAVLTIVGMPLSKTYTMADGLVIYDGCSHTLTIDQKLGYDETVTYRNAKTGSNNVNFTEIGDYEIEAVITRKNYETQVVKATLSILKDKWYSVDSTKTQFKFGSDLKYEKLREELRKNNFTVEIKSYSWQTYPDGRVVSSKDSATTYIYAVDGDKYFDAYIPFTFAGYFQPEYSFGSVFGDYAVKTTGYRDEDGSYSFGAYKIPSFALKETFAGNTVGTLFASLKESKDGGFENSSYPSYYTQFGSFEIKENEFILHTVDYVEHPEFVNHEQADYVFKNIGNTKVEIPSQITYSSEEVDEMDYIRFTKDGIEYFYNSKSDAFEAEIYISPLSKGYLGSGNIEVLPMIFGKKVFKYTIPDSRYRYNKDFTGFTLLLHINDDYDYCGEYADLGYVSGVNNAYYNFIDCGGEVKFYGEW